MQNWLYKLGFEYKNICKNIFITRYKHLDVVEDWNNILTRIEDLKAYIIEFEEDDKINPQIYPSNCAV